MLYTGYLGGHKKYQYPNPLWIARFGPPVDFIPVERRFSPSKDLLWKSKYKYAKENKLSYEEYKKVFLEEQKQNYMKDPDLYINLLRRGLKEDITLLCYCKKESCHRYILYDVLKKIAEKKVPELIFGGEWIGESEEN